MELRTAGPGRSTLTEAGPESARPGGSALWRSEAPPVKTLVVTVVSSPTHRKGFSRPRGSLVNAKELTVTRT